MQCFILNRLTLRVGVVRGMIALRFLVIFYSTGAQGQSLPVELMVGHKNYYYQHSVSLKLSKKSAFGFFHTSSILIPFDGERENEIMSQSYMTFAYNRILSAGVGTLFSPQNRVRPSVSMQLLLQKPHTTVLIFPRADVWKHPACELMGLWEQRSSNSERPNFYGRLQVMTTWSIPKHNRSYQYLRLGVEKKGLCFGLSVNLDEYGNRTIVYTNYGLFLRRVL